MRTGRRDSFDIIAAILAECIASVDLRVLLPKIVRSALSICGGQEASLILRNPHTGKLAIVAQKGKAARTVTAARRSGQNAIVSHAMRHRRPLVLKGNLRGTPFAAFAKRRAILESLCIPLVRGRRCLGALCLNVTDAAAGFDDFAFGKAAIMAAVGAAAIDRAIMEAELKRRYRQTVDEHKRSLRYQQQIIVGERLTSLGIMAASIAHELKSPVTTILTYAELLKSPNLPDDLRGRGVEAIYHEADRMSVIFKQLLAFSRQDDSPPEPVDVNLLVRNTMVFTEHHLSRFKNTTVALNLAEAVPAVLADPGQIQQVFVNMILNAAQAMQAGELAISTRTAPGGSLDTLAPVDYYETLDANRLFVGVTFRDSGPGINPKIVDKLFQPFFTTKKRGEGTGLGLFICKNIVERFGGFIHVEPNPGRGAAFTIFLPSQAVAAPKAEGTETLPAVS